jgi:hypothetical protein
VSYGFDYNPESYDQCRAAAQRWANTWHVDFGISADFFGRWSYRRLPLPANRYGCDATCEVVRPEVVDPRRYSPSALNTSGSA